MFNGSDKVMLTPGSSAATKPVVHPSFFPSNNAWSYVYLAMIAHTLTPLSSFTTTIWLTTADNPRKHLVRIRSVKESTSQHNFVSRCWSDSGSEWEKRKWEVQAVTSAHF